MAEGRDPSGPLRASAEGAGLRAGEKSEERKVHAGVKTAVIVLAILVALLAAWTARRVVLLGFVAILLATVMSFPVSWLERVLRRRGLAVIAVLLVGLGAAGALGAVAAEPLADQARAVMESAPRTLDRLRGFLDRFKRGATGGHTEKAADEVKAAEQAMNDAPREKAPPAAKPAGEPSQLVEAAKVAVPAVMAAVGTVTESILVIVLAAFLIAAPEVYRRGLRRLVPRRHEDLYDELWTRLRDGLRKWVGGILVSMAIMGTLTAAGLALAGIDNWLLLGTLTFVGTFVPYLGAVASAIPGLLVAAGQSPRHLLFAVAVYVGIHVVEGYIVQPVIMRRAVELEPALLLASQALFGAVFGVLGVVVATPVTVCLKLAVEDLWVERRLHKASEPG